jgi:hypothetical protein
MQSWADLDDVADYTSETQEVSQEEVVAYVLSAEVVGSQGVVADDTSVVDIPSFAGERKSLTLSQIPYGECCGEGTLTYVYEKVKSTEPIRCLGSSLAKGKLCPVCMTINSEDKIQSLDIRKVDSLKNLLCIKIRGERISSLYAITSECKAFLDEHDGISLDVNLTNADMSIRQSNKQRNNRSYKPRNTKEYKPRSIREEKNTREEYRPRIYGNTRHNSETRSNTRHNSETRSNTRSNTREEYRPRLLPLPLMNDAELIQ